MIHSARCCFEVVYKSSWQLIVSVFTGSFLWSGTLFSFCPFPPPPKQRGKEDRLIADNSDIIPNWCKIINSFIFKVQVLLNSAVAAEAENNTITDSLSFEVLTYFRKMAPFCIVDILIPFPCLPQPLLPKNQCWILDPQVFFFTSDNIDSGGEGIYGV